MQTPDLFPETKVRKPRSKPRVLAHVVDAGNGCGGEDNPGRNVWAELKCRFGHKFQVFSGHTVTELKRGLPCPTCNPEPT